MDPLREYTYTIQTLMDPLNSRRIYIRTGQWKNRVSFLKAMKKAIELTEHAGTKGIQVQNAVRVDRKEIARIKWIKSKRANQKYVLLKYYIS